MTTSLYIAFGLSPTRTSVVMSHCFHLVFSFFTGSGTKRGERHHHWTVPHPTPADNHDYKLDCGVTLLSYYFFHYSGCGRYYPTSWMEAWSTRVAKPDTGGWISC